MDLKLWEVERALLKLINHYPESGHNGKTVSRLAVDWFDLLTEEGVTSKQFSAGVRHSVKTCSFFPKLVDVLKGVSLYREKPPVQKAGQHMQIEDVTSMHDMTPEEVERNKARLKTITEMLAGKLSTDEAVKAIEANTHIQEFGNGNS
jgi:hypothetical protein